VFRFVQWENTWALTSRPKRVGQLSALDHGYVSFVLFEGLLSGLGGLVEDLLDSERKKREEMERVLNAQVNWKEKSERS